MSLVNGAHFILYSRDAEKDRAFFRDVLGFPAVDAGRGWLIFALPPAEVAFHPAAPGGEAEPAALYLLCEDLSATMETLVKAGVSCTPVAEERWGSITQIALPSGAHVGLYQPKHPTAFSLA